MSEPPTPTHELAEAVIRAIIEQSRDQFGPTSKMVDPQAAQQALVLVLASVYEMDPSIQTPKQLREVGEDVARQLRQQIKLLREHHDAGGARVWDAAPTVIN